MGAGGSRRAITSYRSADILPVLWEDGSELDVDGFWKQASYVCASFRCC